MRVLAASEVLRKPAGGQWRDSMGVRAGARATGEVGGVNRNYDIICGMNGIRGRPSPVEVSLFPGIIRLKKEKEEKN